MKKIFLVLAIAFSPVVTQAQLLITSDVPTDYGIMDSVTVQCSEFYLNTLTLNSQFNVFTLTSDSVPCTAYAEGNVIGTVYSFTLDSIPTVSVMWDSVKGRLEAEGLTVENIE